MPKFKKNTSPAMHRDETPFKMKGFSGFGGETPINKIKPTETEEKLFTNEMDMSEIQMEDMNEIRLEDHVASPNKNYKKGYYGV